MIYLLAIMVLILWVAFGIACERSSNNEYPLVALEEYSLAIRYLIIALGPILYLVFERHLFYSPRENSDITLFETREYKQDSDDYEKDEPAKKKYKK